MVGLLLLLSSVALEVELAGGVAQPHADAPENGPVTPALRLRVGADFDRHLTIAGTVLGIVGDETERSVCGTYCGRNASFKAISGFASLRAHTAGDLQVFLEGGVGLGHLISVSAENLDENPAQHGRIGPAFFVGAGTRWFGGEHVAVGLDLSWTTWTNVSRPAFTYGATDMPARSDLTVSAVLLLLSVAWTSER
jgi:hypothetical protein